MPDLEQPVEELQDSVWVGEEVRFWFKTRQERSAFLAGIDYVNDSAITVGKRGCDRAQRKPYYVVLIDRDRD